MISLPAISITRHSYTNAASFYGTRENNRAFSSLATLRRITCYYFDLD